MDEYLLNLDSILKDIPNYQICRVKNAIKYSLMGDKIDSEITAFR